MFLIFILVSLLSLFLIILNSSISSKSFIDREKLSPFECGFNPQFFSRAPFSMQFFLIAVIFLIFDVEITIIMPIPVIFQYKFISYWMYLSFFFFIILIIGLYHEWNQGALYWPK